jgi:hypothetical protein
MFLELGAGIYTYVILTTAIAQCPTSEKLCCDLIISKKDGTFSSRGKTPLSALRCCPGGSARS